MADGLCLDDNVNSLIDKLNVNKSELNVEISLVKSAVLEKNVPKMKEIDEKVSKLVDNKNGGKSVALVDNVSITLIDKNKHKLIDKSIGLNKKADKDTKLDEDNSQEDEDCRKKRRCADRYDSSESSDSGVATLSCTDSSTASSDTSDPGSPYSPSSVCDDSQQNTKSKQQNANKSTINSNTTVVNSKMAPHTQTTNLNLKLQHQPYQWPWNNTAITTPIPNHNKLKRSQQPQQSEKSNNANGIKRIRSQSTEKKTNNKKLTQMAIVSASNINQVASTIAKNMKNITAPNNVTNNGNNKITAGRVAAAAATTTAAEITTTTEMLTTTATLMQQKSIIKTAATGVPGMKGTNGNMEKILNLIQQQQLIKNINNDLMITPSIPKKVERKTARIAPTVSLTRKVHNTQGSLSVGQSKKPVTIAPRTAEPKNNNNLNYKHVVATTNSSKQDQNLKNPQPTVLLTAIRIPQQQQPSHIASPPKTPTKMGSTMFQFHHQPTAVMPNLVQIPNLVPTQQSAANKITTATSTMINNSGLTAARLNNGTTQLFMNGAVIKLQQIQQQQQQQNITVETTGMNMSLGNILTKPPTISTAVPFTTTTTLSTNQQNKTYTLHPQQQLFQQANQAFAPQQIFMTQSGLLLNASALPTMLASQLNIPALHPLHSNQPQHHQQQNGTTILPSITTLLQSQQAQQNYSQLLANIPQSILANLQASKIPQPQSFQQPSMVPISSHLFLTSTPSLTVTSNSLSSSTSFSTPISITTTNTTSVTPSMSPPPLVATIPTYTNTSAPKLIINSISSVIPAPPTITSEPPKLVPVQPTTVNVDVKPVVSPTTTLSIVVPSPLQLLPPPPPIPLPQLIQPAIQPQLINPLTLDCSSSNDSSVAGDVKSEIVSPAVPILSPKETDFLKISQHLQCQKSPKSLVLERIKQKKPLELMLDEPAPLTLMPTKAPPNIDTEFQTASLPECAKSPILSQPKTIRFPALNGTHHSFGRKGFRKSSDGRLYGQCYWSNCNCKYDTSSKLLDHLQLQHVNTQTGPFTCQWDGCKVQNKQSCSRRWLERHVLSHGGSKPFKCIVGGCGLRFGSQLALEKHVNNHFTNTDNANSSKRSSDPPVPKSLRKNGKKLRYRRQPWSARRFDFFDLGVMEGLQHRLIMTGHLANGPRGAVCFKGHAAAKRTSASGVEVLVQWRPSEIISDEWMQEDKLVLTKQVTIYEMSSEERCELSKYLKINRKANLQMLSDIQEFNSKQEEEKKIVVNTRTSPKKLRKPLKVSASITS